MRKFYLTRKNNCTDDKRSGTRKQKLGSLTKWNNEPCGPTTAERRQEHTSTQASSRQPPTPYSNWRGLSGSTDCSTWRRHLLWYSTRYTSVGIMLCVCWAPAGLSNHSLLCWSRFWGSWPSSHSRLWGGDRVHGLCNDRLNAPTCGKQTMYGPWVSMYSGKKDWQVCSVGYWTRKPAYFRQQ